MLNKVNRNENGFELPSLIAKRNKKPAPRNTKEFLSQSLLFVCIQFCNYSLLFNIFAPPNCICLDWI